MAGISSISGAQSVAQSVLQQLRLRQAIRNAQEAEDTARSLQIAAREARQRASEAQQEARSVTSEADQAQAVADGSRQGLAAIKTAGEIQERLSNTLTRTADRLKLGNAIAPPLNSAQPVINGEGQRTGALINTVA